jgi:hypothetical protein
MSLPDENLTLARPEPPGVGKIHFDVPETRLGTA